MIDFYDTSTLALLILKVKLQQTGHDNRLQQFKSASPYFSKFNPLTAHAPISAHHAFSENKTVCFDSDNLLNLGCSAYKMLKNVTT